MKRLFLEYSQIFLGIVLASIGLKAFLLPNGFLDGGVTGIAILLKDIFDFNISISLVVISIPFLVLAWFTLSKKAVVKSIISIISLALFIQFENFTPLTNDKLLISIFGGLFLGAGIGLAIRNGTVLDGAEVLGIYLNNKYGFGIGIIILHFNTILFIITGICVSMEVAMYSILTFIVTTRVVDFIIKGFEDFIGLMIISTNSQEIESALLTEIGSGVTVYNYTRGYGASGYRENGDIIQLVINRIDIRKTYNLIDRLDHDAFVVEFDVNNIKGGVMKKLLGSDKRSLDKSVIENGSERKF